MTIPRRLLLAGALGSLVLLAALVQRSHGLATEEKYIRKALLLTATVHRKKGDERVRSCMPVQQLRDGMDFTEGDLIELKVAEGKDRYPPTTWGRVDPEGDPSRAMDCAGHVFERLLHKGKFVITAAGFFEDFVKE